MHKDVPKEEASDVLVLGLGITGLSVVRHFYGKKAVTVMDTRDNPPNAQQLKDSFPNVRTVFGALDKQILANTSHLVVSPSLYGKRKFLRDTCNKNCSIQTDIDVFIESTQARVVGVTGTNGKSTVVTLLAHMFTKLGFNALPVGNIGYPVLDALHEEADIYVVELSSFQLGLSAPLKNIGATILNIAPDHLDVHDDYLDYIAAKQRIYKACNFAVFHRNDTIVHPSENIQNYMSIGLDAPANDNELGILVKDEKKFIAQGKDVIMETSEPPIQGQHNILNIMTCLAFAKQVVTSNVLLKETIMTFEGLTHRCCQIAQKKGVVYVNDSKATNVAATIVAIERYAYFTEKRIILIAGGDSKDADFSPLFDLISQYVKTCILLGECRYALEAQWNAITQICIVDSMSEAVERAADIALKGDVVLLSPACASFDMFSSFEARGDAFEKAVAQLPE